MATFDGQADHFEARGCCPFCCTHLSEFTLRIARKTMDACEDCWLESTLVKP